MTIFRENNYFPSLLVFFFIENFPFKTVLGITFVIVNRFANIFFFFFFFAHFTTNLVLNIVKKIFFLALIKL